MEALKERKDMNPEFMWDLSSLYGSDEDWEKEFEELRNSIDRIRTYEGKLSTSSMIREYLDYETSVEVKLSSFYCYAQLRLTEDTRDDKGQEMEARAMQVYSEFVQAASFAEPEILAIPSDKLKAIVGSPELEPYAFTMRKILDEQPHVLSKNEEALLASFMEALSAPEKIAGNLQDADLRFNSVTNKDGDEVELTESNYILLQSSGDRVLRKSSFESFYKTYKEHINTFAAAYNGCVKGAVSEAKVRHYGSSREMSMAAEHIPLQVYDELVDTVHRFMPLMHRYAQLRQKLLKLDELHYYDLYAPLTGESGKIYTYEEAQQMVLDAVAPLGKEYSDRVREAYKDRWMDVYPNVGKQGGAFSSGSYTSNPYILLNFTGTLDSVSTIAHEMGHSQHTWLANHTQAPQNSDYTLFVAEVASTVNENLLIEQLLHQTTDKRERLALLNQYLEGFKGTVYRQTMFAEFEREAHAMAERGEALTASALNELYKRLVIEYFGEALTFDEEVSYEWARIPHFYSPFYVFKYATSYSAAVALSEAILRDGDMAVKKYLEFLSMGGSDYPVEELKHAGVDFTTPAPVERALQKFSEILDEVERLIEEE